MCIYEYIIHVDAFYICLRPQKYVILKKLKQVKMILETARKCITLILKGKRNWKHLSLSFFFFFPDA